MPTAKPKSETETSHKYPNLGTATHLIMAHESRNSSQLKQKFEITNYKLNGDGLNLGTNLELTLTEIEISNNQFKIKM